MPELLVPRQDEQSPALRHYVFAPGGQTARNQPGYYVLSLVLFLASAALLQWLIGVLLEWLAAGNASLREALLGIAAGEPNVSWRWLFLLYGLSYACYTIALTLVVRIVHNRPALSLFTDAPKFNWRRAGAGFLLYSALLAIPLIGMLWGGGMKLHFSPRTFFELLFYSLIVFAIQTSAEESIFRGFLTQAAASIFDSRVLVVILPSILFMFAHFGNPEITADPSALIFYFAFGIFMSLIALRERGLELAIGAHFANNVFNSVVLRSADSVFQTPALIVLPHVPTNSPLLALGGGALVPALYWVATALFLKRR